jgi:transposase
MPKVLKIKDPEGVKERIHDFFSSNDDARFLRRLDVILLICDGHPLPYVAQLFQIDPTTVQRWIHSLNESGFEGLKDKPGRGRQPRLSPENYDRLYNDLEQSPAFFGYETARWDGKLLSHHLKTEYGVELKVRQCQNLFKKLGFSLQRPRKMPIGADPEKREAFKKTPK